MARGTPSALRRRVKAVLLKKRWRVQHARKKTKVDKLKKLRMKEQHMLEEKNKRRAQLKESLLPDSTPRQQLKIDISGVLGKLKARTSKLPNETPPAPPASLTLNVADLDDFDDIPCSILVKPLPKPSSPSCSPLAATEVDPLPATENAPSAPAVEGDPPASPACLAPESTSVEAPPSPAASLHPPADVPDVPALPFAEECASRDEGLKDVAKEAPKDRKPGTIMSMWQNAPKVAQKEDADDTSNVVDSREAGERDGDDDNDCDNTVDDDAGGSDSDSNCGSSSSSSSSEDEEEELDPEALKERKRLLKEQRKKAKFSKMAKEYISIEAEESEDEEKGPSKSDDDSDDSSSSDDSEEYESDFVDQHSRVKRKDRQRVGQAYMKDDAAEDDAAVKKLLRKVQHKASWRRKHTGRGGVAMESDSEPDSADEISGDDAMWTREDDVQIDMEMLRKTTLAWQKRHGQIEDADERRMAEHLTRRVVMRQQSLLENKKASRKISQVFSNNESQEVLDIMFSSGSMQGHALSNERVSLRRSSSSIGIESGRSGSCDGLGSGIQRRRSYVDDDDIVFGGEEDARDGFQMPSLPGGHDPLDGEDSDGFSPTAKRKPLKRGSSYRSRARVCVSEKLEVLSRSLTNDGSSRGGGMFRYDDSQTGFPDDSQGTEGTLPPTPTPTASKSAPHRTKSDTAMKLPNALGSSMKRAFAMIGGEGDGTAGGGLLSRALSDTRCKKKRKA
eukprot:Rmarinus@m.26603